MLTDEVLCSCLHTKINQAEFEVNSCTRMVFYEEEISVYALFQLRR